MDNQSSISEYFVSMNTIITLTSVHKLQIEHDRYIGKKVEERVCSHCNVLEAEVHFLYE